MLTKNFFEYRFQPGENILSHISAIETMAARLKDIGSEVSDEQLITKIIVTLPAGYDHVSAAWDNLDDSKKTISLLNARLLKEELTKKLSADNSLPDSQQAALLASQRGGNRFHTCKEEDGGKSSWTKRPKCDHCGKRNHPEEKCWYKFGKPTEGSKATMANAWPGDYAFTSFLHVKSNRTLDE